MKRAFGTLMNNFNIMFINITSIRQGRDSHVYYENGMSQLYQKVQLSYLSPILIVTQPYLLRYAFQAKLPINTKEELYPWSLQYDCLCKLGDFGYQNVLNEDAGPMRASFSSVLAQQVVYLVRAGIRSISLHYLCG